MAPAVAVTVTVLVTEAGVEAFFPQAARPIRTTRQLNSETTRCFRRTSKQPKNSTPRTIPSVLLLRRNSVADALLVNVSVVVTVAPAGITVAGLKPHVTPVGRPEQVKLTN
jgi:hypothetical protein